MLPTTRAVGELADGPRQHVALALARERVGDVGRRAGGVGHRGEPQLPQLAVGRGGGEPVAVLGSERFEAGCRSFERGGGWGNHLTILSKEGD